MSSHPIASSDFPYPFDFIVKGITCREILRHQMINFVPSTYMAVVEVEIEWRNSEFTRLCTDCGEPLPQVGFVGKNPFKSDVFHMKCVTVERPQDIVRVVLNATMKRKSRRHPDRIQQVEYIGYIQAVDAYKNQLRAAGYPIYEALMIRLPIAEGWESDHV